MGIVREYGSAKTFKTIDEAISIIAYLNENPNNILNYVEALYQEVLPNRYWENVVEKYWIPHFKQISQNAINPNNK